MDNKKRLRPKIPRYTEFLSVDDLKLKTGLEKEEFPEFIVKELIDNSLDAVESQPQIITPEISISIKHFDNKIKIAVSDNGTGISESIIKELVDLEYTFSDKVTYCSPSRGRMGHAISCIFGMPYALSEGGDTAVSERGDPVVIESLGRRYYVKVASDPADLNKELSLCISRQESMENIPGTKFIVTIPIEETEHKISFRHIVENFALVNPHAHFIYSDDERTKEYEPMIDSSTKWSKYLPTERIPPRWYSESIFNKLIKSSLDHNRRITLKAFVGSFKGITERNKINLICDEFPNVKYLAQLSSDRYSKLLYVMQNETSHYCKDLGFVGENNFKKFIEQQLLIMPGKIWYKHIINTIKIPYIIECVVAESSYAINYDFFAINFSPVVSYSSFKSFKESLQFKIRDVDGKDDSNSSIGYSELRKRAGIPTLVDIKTSSKSGYYFILHIVSPHIIVLDKGKTRVNITAQMLKDIYSIIWDVSAEVRSKPDTKTKKETIKNNDLKINEAVFEILPQAVEEATENNKYLVNARGLFYVVRRLILQKHVHIKDLDYNYFSQDILKAYKEKHPLPNVYFDARGFLYEPHTGTVTQVGELEIRNYEFPEWNHNKILYIEKKGILNTLQAAKIAEKYDMAILAGEGYSTEAAKLLLKKGHKDENYIIIILHDCDPDGYNIARTLRADPSGILSDYHIDVIDIGLKYDDAVKMNLISEEYYRDKDIPQGLDLTDDEKEFFKIIPKEKLSKDNIESIKDNEIYDEGDIKKKKKKNKKIEGYSHRYEINAMTPAQMIAFIENKLQFGFLDFIPEEFKDGKDVETMCRSIKKDCYFLEELETLDDTIDCANEILCRTDLFDKLAKAKPHLKLTDDLVKLKNQTEAYRSQDFNDLQDKEQAVIKKFNRLLIELSYPEETPIRYKLDQKLIPNDEVLSNYAQKQYDDKINSLITERIMSLLNIEEIMKNAYMEKPRFENIIETVKEELLDNIEEGWKDLIKNKTNDTVQENIKSLSEEQLKSIIEKHLRDV